MAQKYRGLPGGGHSQLLVLSSERILHPERFDLTTFFAQLFEIVAAAMTRVSTSAEALEALGIHSNHRGATRSVNRRRLNPQEETDDTESGCS